MRVVGDDNSSLRLSQPPGWTFRSLTFCVDVGYGAAVNGEGGTEELGVCAGDGRACVYGVETVYGPTGAGFQTPGYYAGGYVANAQVDPIGEPSSGSVGSADVPDTPVSVDWSRDSAGRFTSYGLSVGSMEGYISSDATSNTRYLSCWNGFQSALQSLQKLLTGPTDDSGGPKVSIDNGTSPTWSDNGVSAPWSDDDSSRSSDQYYFGDGGSCALPDWWWGY
jgi:hypothetical protein